jgi:hypothetical protein
VIETTDKTSMYIIEGTDKAMLIDTGTRCDKLDEVVRKITKKTALRFDYPCAWRPCREYSIFS